MVIDNEVKLIHPRKGTFKQDYLTFIPDADDINEVQLHSLIKDADSVLENNVIPDMITAGIYKDKKSVRRAIKSGVLDYQVQIRVIVDEKCLEEAIPGTDKEIIKLDDDYSAKVIFPTGTHTIVYTYYYGLNYVTRGKLRGGYYLNDYIREEWSDLQSDQVFYQLGDVIRFRHKNEILEGIICCVRYGEYFEPRHEGRETFANTYEVVIRRPNMQSEWNSIKRKWVEHQVSPYTFLYMDDDIVHANDIVEVIGNDCSELISILREDSIDYKREYLVEIGVYES